MKLSAPVYRLKRRARILARQEKIAYVEALDRIARDEGFGAWSLLARRLARGPLPSHRLSGELAAGDLVLVAARLGQGKTLLCLELALDAVRAGRRSWFFSLACGEADLAACFDSLGRDRARFSHGLEVDLSDDICAPYMLSRLRRAEPGSVVVVDYLQALDHRRSNPDLSAQLAALGRSAGQRGLIFLLSSQIRRSFDAREGCMPGLADVRLTNPADLAPFTKACFLESGEIRVCPMA